MAVLQAPPLIARHDRRSLSTPSPGSSCATRMKPFCSRIPGNAGLFLPVTLDRGRTLPAEEVGGARMGSVGVAEIIGSCRR